MERNVSYLKTVLVHRRLLSCTYCRTDRFNYTFLTRKTQKKRQKS